MPHIHLLPAIIGSYVGRFDVKSAKQSQLRRIYRHIDSHG
jgi:hypothetical protein